MQSINIVCIGKLKEKFFTDACNEYIKRLRAFCNINIVELAEYKLSDNPSESQIQICIEKEGEVIAKKLHSLGGKNISLCVEGKELSSEAFAQKLDLYRLNGASTLNLVIGGSYGLSEKVKSLSDFKFSMSKMTFPHMLIRVFLLEQLYRAFQISAGSKYHK